MDSFGIELILLEESLQSHRVEIVVIDDEHLDASIVHDYTHSFWLRWAEAISCHYCAKHRIKRSAYL